MTTVRSNLQSLIAQNALRLNNRALTEAVKQLSTGRRISSAIDDAASSAIATNLTTKIRSLGVSVRNLNDAISLAQTAESSVTQIANMMQRMREMAVQAASGSLTQDQRSYLNQEFNQLQNQLTRTVQDTKFNGISILSDTNQTPTPTVQMMPSPMMMMMTQSFTPAASIPVNNVSQISISQDTGESNTDFITSSRNQIISATLDNPLAVDESLWGSVDGGTTWEDITNSITSDIHIGWSTALATGSGQISFKIIGTGGESVLAASQSYTVDEAAPSVIANVNTFSNDTGISNTDFNTNTSSQTITGTLSGTLGIGEKLLASINGSATFTDITNNVSGNIFTWATSLTSGSNNIRLKVIDAAGNAGTQTIQAYILDQTAPNTTGSIQSLSNDSGVSSTDFNTNIASQTISGSLSTSLDIGDRLLASVDGTDPSINITSSISGTNFNWTTNLVNGNNTIRMKIIDSAGNTNIFNKPYILDNNAPLASAPIESGSNDLMDNLMNQLESVTTTFRTSLITTGSNPLQIGDTVELQLNGSGFAVAKLKTIDATDITNKYIDFTVNAADLGSDGAKSLTSVINDIYGNRSTSAAKTFTIDTTAPSAPTSSILNASTTAYINNNKIAISGMELGATLQYRIDGAGWNTAANINEIVLQTDRTYAPGSIQVRQLDQAQNVGAILSNPQTIILDRVVASPTLKMTDTKYDGDKYTQSNIINVSNLESGASWQYRINNGSWQAGNSSNTITLPLDGSFNVDVKQTDLAQNTSNISSIIGLTTDNTAPGIPQLSIDQDEGNATLSISDSGIMNVALELNSTFKYQIGTGVWKDGVANGSSGTIILPAGRYPANTIKVKQIDLAGNESAVYAYPKETLINLAFLVPSTDNASKFIAISSVNLDGDYKTASISSDTAATLAISALDKGLAAVNRSRSKFASAIQALTSRTDLINVQLENISRSRSQIMDTDYAQATSDWIRAQIIQNAGIAVLTQANHQPSMVVQLLS